LGSHNVKIENFEGRIKVFIDGELISEKGRVLKVDEEEAYRKIEENAYKFRQKAEETPVSPPWKPPWMSG